MGSRSKAVLREDGGDPCKIWRYNDDEDDGDNDDHDPEDGDDGDGENSDAMGSDGDDVEGDSYKLQRSIFPKLHSM